MASPGQQLIQPWDEFNQQLVANVHPQDWKNPAPASRYHLVVLGAGTAGLVTAAGAASLGAKVALVERHLMGGDCLNVGCVPSKTLIRAARAAHETRNAGEFGVRARDVQVDFATVMERVRRVRAGISPHDSARRFRDLGVDVFIGEGRFRDSDTIQVGDALLRFKRAVIATGARAAEPIVPGLKEAGYLTNETVFSLTQLPKRLAIVGGGPIGCELAQAFQRLGAQVTLFHNKGHLLDREDDQAAQIVQNQFSREGIRLELRAKLLRAERDESGIVLQFSNGGSVDSTANEVFDAVLVAVGRIPNVDGMNLDAVGVQSDLKRGLQVDDFLRTTNPRVFAAGDVCMNWKFTHAADFAARIVIQNALFFGRKRVSTLMMPWCTYTVPEVAHVGVDEQSASKSGLETETFTQPFDRVDRALTEGQPDGFVKILVRKGSDSIVGATIVGPHAGDLISEVSVAMKAGLGLGGLANVIHPYPTLAEAIRKCGDAYNRTKLTPRVKGLLNRWLSWTK